MYRCTIVFVDEEAPIFVLDDLDAEGSSLDCPAEEQNSQRSHLETLKWISTFKSKTTEKRILCDPLVQVIGFGWEDPSAG